MPGIAKTITLTLFDATLNCDIGSSIGSPPVLTYSGLQSDGTTAYNYATDKIGVDSATGVISIDAGLSGGSHPLIIKGTL